MTCQRVRCCKPHQWPDDWPWQSRESTFPTPPRSARIPLSGSGHLTSPSATDADSTKPSVSDGSSLSHRPTRIASPSLITEWAGEVEIVSPKDATKKSVLVRPDAYIAWAISDESPEHRIDAARQALTEWCGTQGSVSPTG
ncbi:hypothetical protein ACFV90_32880 [Streptomyces sp. NPDC059904]|uniref:aromatic-ring hydroxylase C-terminal domain-containing protein n=1 Tax=unclassified Streptomyces TaxID=2593676 RepID=UPI00364EF9E9